MTKHNNALDVCYMLLGWWEGMDDDDSANIPGLEDIEEAVALAQDATKLASKSEAVKHSPAPWSQDPEGEYCVSIEDAKGNVIINVLGQASSPLCEANCKVVEQSPRLLDAVRRLIHPMADEADVQFAQEVIAAATGELQ